MLKRPNSRFLYQSVFQFAGYRHLVFGDQGKSIFGKVAPLRIADEDARTFRVCSRNEGEDALGEFAFVKQVADEDGSEGGGQIQQEVLLGRSNGDAICSRVETGGGERHAIDICCENGDCAGFHGRDCGKA